MRAFALALLLCSTVAACTGAGTTGDNAGAGPATGETAASAPATSGDAAAQPARGTDAAPSGVKPGAAAADRVTPPRAEPAPPMSDPLPPEVLPGRASAGAPALDRSCRTSADCAVKNVGNCCGAMPACVNRGARTDPAAVQAQCAREGMSSVCGFKEVTSCSCVAGTCQDGGSAVTE